MRSKFLFRIDDICPGMDWNKFNRVEKIFDKYKILPIIGVIPKNFDLELKVNKDEIYNVSFWNKIKKLTKKGWIVAQHGFDHVYINNDSGLMKITKRSEFCKLSYEEQYKKIKLGKEILENNLGIKVEWWMAPAHSFDETTLKVLKDLGFKYITDGFYLGIVKKNGMVWVPQQLWRPIKMPFGLWTICLHLNGFNNFTGLENFVKNNLKNCKEFDFSPNNFFGANLIFSFFWHSLLNFSRLFKV